MLERLGGAGGVGGVGGAGNALGLLAVAPVAVAAAGPLVHTVIAQAAVGDYTTAVGVGIGAAAIVIALVQALKMAGLPSRYAALVSVGVGVAYACLVHWANLAEGTPGAGSWANTVAVGISLGLGASGLYSGTKAVIARADRQAAQLADAAKTTTKTTPTTAHGDGASS